MMSVKLPKLTAVAAMDAMAWLAALAKLADEARHATFVTLSPSGLKISSFEGDCRIRSMITFDMLADLPDQAAALIERNLVALDKAISAGPPSSFFSAPPRP